MLRPYKGWRRGGFCQRDARYCTAEGGCATWGSATAWLRAARGRSMLRPYKGWRRGAECGRGWRANCTAGGGDGTWNVTADGR